MILVFPLPGQRRPFHSARKGDSVMTKIIHGKVHGKTIELDDDLGVPERQELQVTVLHFQKMWGGMALSVVPGHWRTP